MSNTHDASHSEQSPFDNDTPSGIKRRRIALACLDCRRRKLKCDRIFPACTRCQKGGHSDTCTYNADAIETISAPSSVDRPRTNGHRNIVTADTIAASRSPVTHTSFANHHQLDTDDSTIGRMKLHIHQLENRISALERIANESPQWADSARRNGTWKTDHWHGPNKPEPEDKELMMFRGRSFKTSFYGASHRTSYLSHLPNLRTFMKEMIVQHPGLAQVQRELKGAKFKGPVPHDDPVDHKSLLRLLPARVVHLPSFWEEYSSLWQAPDEARTEFVALILLIIATTNCIKRQDPSLFRGDSSLGRETACVWIQACESWLRLQSQKHTSLTNLQSHCVLFIAKQMNSVKRKRTWTSAGTLMSFAIAAGLHRDAEVLNLRHGSLIDRKVSLFDQEMRRRLWSTISELELQAAIDRGMPMTLPHLIVDCGPPSNCDDEELSQLMDQRPKSRPFSEYTRSSFQNIMSCTWNLRKEIVSLINGSGPHLNYEDMLSYDRMIMHSLDEIPNWNSAEATFSQSLLQLQMHQLLTFMHRPFLQCGQRSPRFSYSSTIYLGAAKAIVDAHHKLVSAGNAILSVFRQDIVGAALSICYSFAASKSTPTDHALPYEGIVQNISDSVQSLERALTMCEDKIMRLGIGIQEYYCISSCIGLLKKSISTTARSEEFQAADRVAKMIQRVLSLEDKFSAAATLASLPNMAVTAPTKGHMTNGNGIPTAAQLGTAEVIEVRITI
ncbi:MAG: hypothetical protein Q9163_004127 [Psora crenata]